MGSIKSRKIHRIETMRSLLKCKEFHYKFCQSIGMGRAELQDLIDDMSELQYEIEKLSFPENEEREI